jgi:methionyl aminopeptidase
MITCKSRSEVLLMERATRIVQEVLAECVDAVRPGATTEEIDRIAASGIKSRGGKPAFLGYRGYPKVICVSINEEVVHGIPTSKRKLRDGDVVGLDLGAIVEGYYGDAARTVGAGKVAPETEQLLRVTHEALLAGVGAVRVGGKIGDIGAAVEAVATKHGYGIVREFVGHGIGTSLHEKPEVPNYGPAGRRETIREGMTLAIEPMLNLGGAEVRVASDGWTVKTLDGKPSAHFEHTVVATADGPVVLGFGRYTREGAVTGAPEFSEYPAVPPVKSGAVA